MKVCIPVVSPEGLSSRIESDPAGARFLHFFDTESASFEEVDLAAVEVQPKAFDSVICTQISRHVFGALRERGVEVFLCEAETVQEALLELRSGTVFRIPDEPRGGGCGGGCHGHGSGEHAHGEGCGGGGCHGAGGHSHDEGDSACKCHSGSAQDGKAHACGGAASDADSHAQGGCGCGGKRELGACQDDAASLAAKKRMALTGALKIAVTSQNRKAVTEHAGKCRKFWVYEIDAGRTVGKTLLELSLEQSLHEWNSSEKHPLADVDVLITASAGDGMKTRLAAWGIAVLVAEQTEPDAAVAAFLATSGS